MRLSPLYCTGLSLRLRGSSYAAIWSGSQQREQHLPLPEKQLGYADRVFQDGYVKQDPGTGHASSVVPDSTWFWGYDSAGQYDPLQQTLSFRKISWAQQQETTLSGQSWSERSCDQTGSAIGLELSGEYPLLRGERSQLGLQLAWMTIPNFDFRQQMQSYTCTRNRSSRLLEVLETFTYDVSGIIIPPPGHAGTYLGPFDSPPTVPSTVIPNRPSTIDQTLTGNSRPASSSSEHYHNQVRYDLSCTSNELHLGLIFRYQLLADRLALTLAPAAAVQLLSIKGKRRETMQLNGRTTASWQDRKYLQRLHAGLAIAGRLEFHCRKGWFLDSSVAYHWYPQEAEITLGPGRISLQGNKIILGFSLGYRF